MLSSRLKNHVNLNNLTFLFALVLFVWVIWYCFTGSGGAQELVSRLLPIALVLQILFTYQKEPLYKRLPTIANHVLVVVYIGICVYALVIFICTTRISPSGGKVPTRSRISSSACSCSCW